MAVYRPNSVHSLIWCGLHIVIFCFYFLKKGINSFSSKSFLKKCLLYSKQSHSHLCVLSPHFPPTSLKVISYIRFLCILLLSLQANSKKKKKCIDSLISPLFTKVKYYTSCFFSLFFLTENKLGDLPYLPKPISFTLPFMPRHGRHLNSRQSNIIKCRVGKESCFAQFIIPKQLSRDGEATSILRGPKHSGHILHTSYTE